MSVGEKGLDPEKDYPSIVVGNADPDRLGRVQARPEDIFDGIADGDLPWCIPDWAHPDGASPESGIMLVPKVGSKVRVRFQGGSMAHPVYYGYNVDKQTRLPEAEQNYPNRAVIRFKCGMCVVIDTQEDDVFVQMPGDVKMAIAGNLDLTVIGDMTTRVGGNRSDATNGNLVQKASSVLTWSSGMNVQYGESYMAFGQSVAFTAYGSVNMNGLGGGIDLDGGNAPTAPAKPTVPSDTLPGMPRGVQAQDWTDQV